jgi:2-(1,2-epoxy-1,2-dihydrophenyl)acetyl-CoA isomerase
MNYPAYETLDLTVNDGIAVLRLNRPEKLNAMSMKMRRELGDCFFAIADDTDIRVVVLTGAGSAFCAGGDINDFQGNSSETMHTIMGRTSHRWFRAFWNLPQPVIAAVNGPAAGGGCNLALACDLAYASSSAYFCQTFMEIGLMPDLGGAFQLPRLVGPMRAKELALFGDRVAAPEAAAMGLINAVFAADRLMDEVMQRAARLSARPASAVSLTKRIMNRAFEASMETILDEEHAAQSFLFSTEANRLGVERFLTARGKGSVQPPVDGPRR